MGGYSIPIGPNFIHCGRIPRIVRFLSISEEKTTSVSYQPNCRGVFCPSRMRRGRLWSLRVQETKRTGRHVAIILTFHARYDTTSMLLMVYLYGLELDLCGFIRRVQSIKVSLLRDLMLSPKTRNYRMLAVFASCSNDICSSGTNREST